MKHIYLVAITVLIAIPAWAQPNYYESRARQTAEYKTLSSATNRAYSVPGSTYTPPSNRSTTTSSSSPSSTRSSGSAPVIINNNNNGYANLGADDRIRRQEAAAASLEKRRQEQMAIISTDEAKYRKLIAGMGIAKTADDYYDLVLVALRNGIDMRSVHRVIGKDIKQYIEIWGVHPDKPYMTSDGRVQQAAHALSVINDPEYKGEKALYYLDIAKAYPNETNLKMAAEACLVEGFYQKAIYRYEDLLKIKPDDFQAVAGMAAAQAFLNYLPQAEGSFLRIINKTDNPDIIINLAWVYFLREKNADAITMIKRAIDSDPNHPGFHLLQTALENKSSNINAPSVKAGELLPLLGKDELSGQFLEMIKFLHKEGAYQESIIYLDFAVKVFPKNIDLREMRFGTNIKINRKEEAAIDTKILNTL